MFCADSQLRQGILIASPVRIVRRDLPEIAKNRRQPGGAQVPKVGAVHQMLHRPFHIRAVGKQFQGMVDMANG